MTMIVFRIFMNRSQETSNYNIFIDFIEMHLRIIIMHIKVPIKLDI